MATYSILPGAQPAKTPAQVPVKSPAPAPVPVKSPVVALVPVKPQPVAPVAVVVKAPGPVAPAPDPKANGGLLFGMVPKVDAAIGAGGGAVPAGVQQVDGGAAAAQKVVCYDPRALRFVESVNGACPCPTVQALPGLVPSAKTLSNRAIECALAGGAKAVVGQDVVVDLPPKAQNWIKEVGQVVGAQADPGGGGQILVGGGADTVDQPVEEGTPGAAPTKSGCWWCWLLAAGAGYWLYKQSKKGKGKRK